MIDRVHEMKTAMPACQRCRFYQVTWDAQAPYGCKAHGFKSSRNPALVVFESSGAHCLLFEPRKPPATPQSLFRQ